MNAGELVTDEIVIGIIRDRCASRSTDRSQFQVDASPLRNTTLAAALLPLPA